MVFNHSQLHTPTNAIKSQFQLPCMCILIILLCIPPQNTPRARLNAAVTMATQSGKALMSESPPRTLVQAPGQVTRTAAGLGRTPRNKMAACQPLVHNIGGSADCVCLPPTPPTPTPLDLMRIMRVVLSVITKIRPFKRQPLPVQMKDLEICLACMCLCARIARTTGFLRLALKQPRF